MILQQLVTIILVVNVFVPLSDGAAVKRAVVQESMVSFLTEQAARETEFEKNVLNTLSKFKSELMSERKNEKELKSNFSREIQNKLDHVESDLGTHVRHFEATVKNVSRLRQEDTSTFETVGNHVSTALERILNSIYCPADYRYREHSCYKFGNQTVDWQTARKRCADENAHLVSMETNEKKTAVTSLLKEPHVDMSALVWTRDKGKTVSDKESISASNLVTEAQIGQLKKWIPQKEFVLCYRATRDGMSGSAFHGKCNNVGPTVSIGLDATSGYVFGGYASQPWKSRGSYVRDDAAFIFKLCGSGCTSKRLNQDGTYASFQYDTYDGTSYSPTFGGGHDLVFFYSSSYTFDSTNKYFATNGHCYSKGYNYGGGLGCGSSVKWRDVEVYSVVDPRCPALRPKDQQLLKKSCDEKANYICEV